MRRAPHQPAAFQLADDLGHGRRAYPLDVGQLARRQRAAQLQAGQRGELRDREITDRPALADPPVEPSDRVPQHRSELLSGDGRHPRHLVSLTNELG
jgi:hypothetical protein